MGGIGGERKIGLDKASKMVSTRNGKQEGKRELVTPRDVEDLRDLIDDLGANNRFGLFIALQDPQEMRSLFDETLRSMCDLVVLGEEDIARIVRTCDHRRALMESILNQVDLRLFLPLLLRGLCQRICSSAAKKKSEPLSRPLTV